MATLRGIERVIVATCSPLLIIVGGYLLVLGVTGEVTVFGKGNGFEISLLNISPGVMCFLLSGIQSYFVLASKVIRKKNTEEETSTKDPVSVPETKSRDLIRVRKAHYEEECESSASDSGAWD